MKNLKIILLGFLGALIFHIIDRQYAIGTTRQTNPILTASAINLVDNQGRLRGQYAISKEGSPGIWLMDDKGVPRLSMGVYPDGAAYMGLQDKNGQMILLARSVGSDEAPLLIFKTKGQDSMIMGLNSKNKTPFLMNYDANHKRTHVFGTSDGL
ncbi:MAG: hypothetical protein K2Q18_04700 [Bdellovibrionales bacterium]|nr:hypothetical protein [Bdellovibrionales bacterium]